MRRSLAAWIFPAVAVLAAALSAHGTEKVPRVAAAAFGEPFPPAVLGNLNPGAGEPQVDLSAVLGKRPVVLVYLIPGNERSEATLSEVRALLKAAGGDKVAVYALVAVASGQDPGPVTARVREVGIEVPVLMDTDFRFGQMLQVQSVPSVSVIDAAGRLRLANAASLKQDLEYKMTVADGLRRVASTGSLGTYGALPRYDPSVELVGAKAPDFVASGTDGVARRWSTLIDPRKVNVLIYWSVECPHCRKTIPEINAWLAQNGDGVNVVSVAKAQNEALKVRTREFTNLHGLSFPTLIDTDDAIFDAYKITATPTMFVVGPDGVVESLLSPSADFGAQVTAKKKDLLPAKAGG